MKLRHVVLALSLAGAGFSDTLLLRDGRSITGSYLGGNSRQVRMESGSQVHTFDVSAVASIAFDGSQAPTAAAPPAPAASFAPPAQPAVTGIEMYAGTALTIRVIDAIDSDRAQVGQTFRASMDEPVYTNGNQVIPRGADVILALVDSRQSGRIAGRSALTLSLRSVAVNGRMVDVNTQSVTEASSSRGARTAKVAAGGAGVGAIIGGIAGVGRAPPSARAPAPAPGRVRNCSSKDSAFGSPQKPG